MEDADVIAELAQLVLANAAPDELVIFEETAQEYFADPQATLEASTKDAAVGFGLDLAMMTPVVLAIGGVIVQSLAGSLADQVVDKSKQGTLSLIRRMFRRGPATEPPVTLTAHQATQVRQIAWERARSLGLADDQAALLADSFVGALATT